MELGLTHPLKRHLKLNQTLHASANDPYYSWDLHIITLQGKSCLLGVHCGSRTSFVLYDLSQADWSNLAQKAIEGICLSLQQAGFTKQQLDQYLHDAGAPGFTKTHGRREVAFLNRAWEDVLRYDYALESSVQLQSFLTQQINLLPCHCAGRREKATAYAHFKALFPSI